MQYRKMSLHKISGLLFVIFLLSVRGLFGLPEDKPINNTSGWVRTGGPIGGLGYDIRYNFENPDIWYVTDDWAGFFISTDNGLSWNPSNQGVTAVRGVDGIPIFSATVDPHQPNIIWAGTDIFGHIYKSTDGGYNWMLKRNGVDTTLNYLSFRGFTVDPRTSDIVYAMGEIASLAWTPNLEPITGLEMDLTMGIVYKTTNGGDDWTEIWRGDNMARYCCINPRDPDILYVSTGIFDREAANTDTATGFAGGVGILKSTDGGDTWEVLDQDQGLLDLYVGSLYMHPVNPDTLLAAAAQNNWSAYTEEFTGGVFLTRNGGEDWERVLKDELFSVVEYSTANPNIAYAVSDQAVHRSEDGGQTWTRFSRDNNTWGPEGIVAGFPIDAQCDPRVPFRIFVNGYLGGNFLSEDGGETWILSSEGYSGALVSHLAVAPGHSGTIYTGSRSGIYRSNDGGDNYIGLVYPPEGMFAKFNEITCLAVNPSNPNHVLTMASDQGAILYTYDGGFSWEISTSLGTIMDLEFAPTNPSTVYAGTHSGLFVSNDGGEAFDFVDHQVSVENSIMSLAIHPQDSNTVFISTLTEELYKTTDGGLTWNSLGTGLPTSAPITELIIDPSNPEIMFAGFRFADTVTGKVGVYRSTDGGGSWAQSSAGLEPNAEISSIVVDPTDGQIVYACDFLSGVYGSSDGGNSWIGLNENLDHKNANVLALSDDGMVLYVGIEGAGIYRIGESGEPSRVADRPITPESFHLEQNFPNPFNPVTTISYRIQKEGPVSLKIVNMLGEECVTLVDERQHPGSHSVTWDGMGRMGRLLGNGVYFYTLKAGEFVDTKKLVIMK